MFVIVIGELRVYLDGVFKEFDSLEFIYNDVEVIIK